MKFTEVKQELGATSESQLRLLYGIRQETSRWGLYT